MHPISEIHFAIELGVPWLEISNRTFSREKITRNPPLSQQETEVFQQQRIDLNSEISITKGYRGVNLSVFTATVSRALDGGGRFAAKSLRQRPAISQTHIVLGLINGSRNWLCPIPPKTEQALTKPVSSGFMDAIVADSGPAERATAVQIGWNDPRSPEVPIRLRNHSRNVF
ncbi:hypothetical protein J6590_029966 [Homalodisca vitripennis]|nr:hypothetical protein J6590_029966 [Homalodisca vitripennis]